MVRRSGQRGVPVTVVDDQVVVGFDQRRLEQLLAHRRPATPKLGVLMADARKYGAKRGLSLPPGAYLGRVEPGSPAARAGLRKGDVIVEISGQVVTGDADLRAVLARLSPGQAVPLTVMRDGRTVQTMLTL